MKTRWEMAAAFAREAKLDPEFARLLIDQADGIVAHLIEQHIDRLNGYRGWDDLIMALWRRHAEVQGAR